MPATPVILLMMVVTLVSTSPLLATGPAGRLAGLAGWLRDRRRGGLAATKKLRKNAEVLINAPESIKFASPPAGAPFKALYFLIVPGSSISSKYIAVLEAFANSKKNAGSGCPGAKVRNRAPINSQSYYPRHIKVADGAP